MKKEHFTATQDGGACLFWRKLVNGKIELHDDDNPEVKLEISEYVFENLKTLIRLSGINSLAKENLSFSVKGSQDSLMVDVNKKSATICLSSDPEQKIITTMRSWEAFVDGIKEDKVKSVLI